MSKFLVLHLSKDEARFACVALSGRSVWRIHNLRRRMFSAVHGKDVPIEALFFCDEPIVMGDVTDEVLGDDLPIFTEAREFLVLDSARGERTAKNDGVVLRPSGFHWRLGDEETEEIMWCDFDRILRDERAAF